MSMSPEEIAFSALAGLDTLAQCPKSKNPAAKSVGEGTAKPSRKRRGPKPKVKLPIEPRVVQTIPKCKEYVNHNYSDFSIVPNEPGYEAPSKIEDMSFAEKLHAILAEEEYSKWISWRPHGRAFCITVPVMFEKKICEKYFGHKRYSSFLRQINNHGFKHLTKGADRNSYYHECFLKGMVHLCSYMPEPKDARRQIPDPVNEPDFEAISRLYPVLAKTAHISRPDGLLTLPEHNPTVKTAAAPAIVAQKVGMDRNAALEEIKRLRARLASDVAPLSRNAPTEPFAKRQAVLASGLLGQIPVRQLARMPQPFPTRARGLSQLEVILQRNAIVSAIRKQQQQESQQQQLQELQIQQQLQELRTQQQMEEIQAQQRQLQDLTTQQTLQHLQAQHVVSDFQKQHSLQELQLASAAHQLQQHHQLQDLRNQLALQNFQQPTSTTPTGLSSVSNAASFEEYLRRTSLFP